MYTLNAVPDKEARITGALEISARRGPDSSAYRSVDAKCIFGSNRLAIQGGDAGKQPFDLGHLTVSYNGEIYNWREWSPESEFDGLAIAKAYQLGGVSSLSSLRGEFALSIWDRSAKRLILARDAFGRRPLYFAFIEGGLTWASTESELLKLMNRSPILCAGMRSSTYRHAFAVQEPYSSFRGIWSLPPGHFMVVNERGLELTRFFTPRRSLSAARESYLNFVSAMKTSLATRLNANTPVAIPMSGGVDSGIIAFTANRLRVPFEVFSVVSMFGKRTREADTICRRIERLDGAKAVHLLEVTEWDYELALSDIFTKCCFDSARFDSGAIGLHRVLREVQSRGIRIVLDGTGGDELFHGYKFRDEFQRPSEWPSDYDSNSYFYSLWTSLLDYNGKVERLGGHFSIEARFPFQDESLLECSLGLPATKRLKWPLRQFLADHCDYGELLPMDIGAKYGFSTQGRSASEVANRMEASWMRSHGIREMPQEAPLPFPFRIGAKCSQIAWSTADSML